MVLRYSFCAISSNTDMPVDNTPLDAPVFVASDETLPVVFVVDCELPEAPALACFCVTTRRSLSIIVCFEKLARQLLLDVDLIEE